MAYSTYEKDTTADLLKDRKPKFSMVHPLLYPITPTTKESGILYYQTDTRTIDNLNDLRVDDESTLTFDQKATETPLPYTCVRYGKAAKAYYNEIKRTPGQMSMLLDEKYQDIDFAFEKHAKTVWDTVCVPATPTKTTVTTAKWTPATYSAIIIDMNTAWEAFMAVSGVAPNLIFGHPSVIEVINQAFGLIDEPYKIADILKLGVSETMYQTIRKAPLVSADAMYRDSSTTYAYIWDKRLYMAYTSALPTEDTGTKTYGAMMNYRPDGKEYYIGNKVEELTGDEFVSALTYKTMLNIDNDCVWEIAGPSGGSYDLV